MVAVGKEVGHLQAKRRSDRVRLASIRVAVDEGATIGTDGHAEGARVVAVVSGAASPQLMLRATRLAAVGLKGIPEQAQGIAAHANALRAVRLRSDGSGGS